MCLFCCICFLLSFPLCSAWAGSLGTWPALPSSSPHPLDPEGQKVCVWNMAADFPWNERKPFNKRVTHTHTQKALHFLGLGKATWQIDTYRNQYHNAVVILPGTWNGPFKSSKRGVTQDLVFFVNDSLDTFPMGKTIHDQKKGHCNSEWWTMCQDSRATWGAICGVFFLYPVWGWVGGVRVLGGSSQDL